MKHAARGIGMFALILIVLMYLCLCLCLISSASASPLVTIEVSNTTSAAYESITELNPGDGNWIEMVGGKEMSLPTIRLVYNIKSTNYTKGDKKIKIIPYVEESEDYSVHYPFSEHSVYYNGDGVKVKVLGERDIAGEEAHIYLIKTCPSEVNDAWNSTFDGDIKSLRDLLNNSIDERKITLDSAGDCTVSFGTLNPGDYVVAATLNASSAQNITFISTTAFEVFAHKSSFELETRTITRTSISDYRFASGSFNITGADAGATYNYVVALIRKDEKFDLRWDCDETKSELNLKLRDAPQTKSINVLGGIGLGKLTPCIIYDWILTFQTASVEKGKSGTTYEFSLPVIDMPDGDYYLYAMACNRTMPARKTFASALAQKSVKIRTLVEPKLTISITANPERIEANGVNTSTITAKVTDEFGRGISGIKVSFSTTLGTIDSPKTTIDEGIAATILTSSTSPGTAVVEGTIIIDDIPIRDTVLVAFIETEESGCCNESLGNVTVTVEETETGTNVSVTKTTVRIEGGVITISTTVESAIKIADKATAGSVISIPIENATLEITLEEDARRDNNIVIGNISKIRLNTPPEEYITSRPEIVGTASIDLDVDFRGTVTPCIKLYFKATPLEKYKHLPVLDPGKIKDTLAAHFDVDTSAIADHTPILVHAELSGIAPSDITGVPISITVNKEWYDTVARGNKNNVVLFKISDDGKRKEAKSPIRDSVNDRITFLTTFLTTFDHSCVFAIVARPPEAPPPPIPGDDDDVGGAVVGPIPVPELEITPSPAPTHIFAPTAAPLLPAPARASPLTWIMEIPKSIAPIVAQIPRIPMYWILIAIAAIIFIVGIIVGILRREDKIKIGVMPDEAALPYYVAAREGIFADHGLNVKVVPFQSAVERDSALTAGKIDAAESDPVGVILLRNADYNARVVGVELQETAEKMRFAIVASPSSNISSIEDLDGKKIAIARNTIVEYVTDTLLGGVHTDKEEVKEVPKRMQMLLDNEIDAATLPEPLASHAIYRGAKLIISDAMLNRGISQTVMAFSGEFIEKNPASVDKFLDAYREAVERINADPENWRALLVEKVRIPGEIAESYKIATYLQPQPYPRDKFEAVLHWMQSNDLVQKEVSYKDVVLVLELLYTKYKTEDMHLAAEAKKPSRFYKIINGRNGR